MPLAVRYLGMAVSWFGFALSFTLLFLSMRAVLDVGGFCAEGGPYVIATHCPGQSAWMTPVSVYLGLASVAIGFFFSRGLGASIVLSAWPVLFIGLGLNFLQFGFTPDGLEPVGLLLGGMFILMGAAPLFVWMRRRINRSAIVAGTTRIDGKRIGDLDFSWGKPKAAAASDDLSTILGLTPEGSTGENADSEDQSDGLGLRSIDYLVLVPLWLAEALLGVVVGIIWFNG